MGRSGRALLTAALGAAVFAAVGATPALSGVNVNLNIGPPAVVVAEPPEMVVVPQSMVYFAPGVSVELLFFDGYWWTPKEGRWFRATAYNGPWTVVGPRHVPAELVHLPPGYRARYGHGEHIPYGQLKKHHRYREIERREHRGEWKEVKREHRERDRERVREHRERDRERVQDHREREREGGGRGRGR